jgi:hypothetical protein
MLPRSPDTDAFWQAFRLYAGADHDNYVVGSFGDSPEMATQLADLVMNGIKRATASLARDYGEGARTDDNLLRQVVYEGLREDKPAADVRRALPHPKSRMTETTGVRLSRRSD